MVYRQTVQRCRMVRKPKPAVSPSAASYLAFAFTTNHPNKVTSPSRLASPAEKQKALSLSPSVVVCAAASGTCI
jgi:hypothetical protein